MIDGRSPGGNRAGSPRLTGASCGCRAGAVRVPCGCRDYDMQCSCPCIYINIQRDGIRSRREMAAR